MPGPTGLKGTYATQLDDFGNINLEQKGQHRYEDGKWYKWVQYLNVGFANAVPISDGDFLGYYGVNGLGNNQVTGDTSVASNRGLPAGVAMSAPTVGGDGFWIQIKGYAKVAAGRLHTDVADGDLLQLHTADKLAADGNAAGAKVLGVAVDESDGEIYLDCPW